MAGPRRGRMPPWESWLGLRSRLGTAQPALPRLFCKQARFVEPPGAFCPHLDSPRMQPEPWSRCVAFVRSSSPRRSPACGGAMPAHK